MISPVNNYSRLPKALYVVGQPLWVKEHGCIMRVETPPYWVSRYNAYVYQMVGVNNCGQYFFRQCLEHNIDPSTWLSKVVKDLLYVVKGGKYGQPRHRIRNTPQPPQAA